MEHTVVGQFSMPFKKTLAFVILNEHATPVEHVMSTMYVLHADKPEKFNGMNFIMYHLRNSME